MSEDTQEKMIRGAGFSARLADKPIDDCPFRKETFSAKTWEDGWRKADYELKAAKRRY